MNDVERDDLDRLLSGDDMVMPSARFAAEVMEAVERAANEPPLPFPWGRFAIGIAGCLGMAAGGAQLVDSSMALAAIDSLSQLEPMRTELAAAAAVVVASLAIVRFQGALRLSSQ